MTQFSENICENLDENKKDLNGQVISDKSQFSSDPSKDYGFYGLLHDFEDFSCKNLIAQQKKDPEIIVSLNKALSEDEMFSPCRIFFSKWSSHAQMETC